MNEYEQKGVGSGNRQEKGNEAGSVFASVPWCLGAWVPGCLGPWVLPLVWNLYSISTLEIQVRIIEKASQYYSDVTKQNYILLTNMLYIGIVSPISE